MASRAVFNLSDTSLLKIIKVTSPSGTWMGYPMLFLFLQVNSTNKGILGGGGVDGAIHRAAGPHLRKVCYAIPEVSPGVRCPTGEARITVGFKVYASHVIHTVGPVYESDVNPKESLTSSYKNSLIVAKENNIKYIAFPAISCGNSRYPFDEAAVVAISTIKEYANDFKEVIFVLSADEIYNVWVNKANEMLQKA